MPVKSLVGALIVTGLAVSAFAQQPPAQALTVHTLKAGALYWIEGGGGNTGVIVGQNGVVVVDSKTTADAGRQVVSDIAALTPKPITHLIYTHSDGDHVNGSVSFPDGLVIIGQENEKKEMETALAGGGRGAPPANRLPTQTVSGVRTELTLDGVHVVLLHWGPAHTSGDLVVYLPDDRVVFTGDIIATQRPDPIIHPEKGGSSAGWITTATNIAALDADTFVPGHGDVQTKADLQKRIAATTEKRNRIVALVGQGKSLDEIKAAVGDAPPAPAPGGRGGRGGGFASLTDIVYNELTKK
jgi:cyclase